MPSRNFRRPLSKKRRWDWLSEIVSALATIIFRSHLVGKTNISLQPYSLYFRRSTARLIYRAAAQSARPVFGQCLSIIDDCNRFLHNLLGHLRWHADTTEFTTEAVEERGGRGWETDPQISQIAQILEPRKEHQACGEKRSRRICDSKSFHSLQP